METPLRPDVRGIPAEEAEALGRELEVERLRKRDAHARKATAGQAVGGSAAPAADRAALRPATNLAQFGAEAGTLRHRHARFRGLRWAW